MLRNEILVKKVFQRAPGIFKKIHGLTRMPLSLVVISDDLIVLINGMNERIH